MSLAFNKEKHSEMSKRAIIWIARQGMKTRKSRVRFTVFAMVLGIGIVVFLTSIGFGLRRLVISEIASLHSLRTTDVTSGSSRTIKIKQDSINEFKKINGVKKVEPLIALVGKAEFKGSSFDVGIFGATNYYFELSDIQPVYGKIYESNETEKPKDEVKTKKAVQDISRAENKKTTKKFLGGIIKEKIIFNINEGEWVKVRGKPSLNGKILGYAKKLKKAIIGKEVFGEEYQSITNIGRFTKATASEKYLGKWIFAKVPLWEKVGENYFVPILENGRHKEIFGYFGENGIIFNNLEEIKAALVEKKKEKTPKAEVVELEEKEEQKKDILGILPKDVVINEAALTLMGIKNKEVIGKTITLNISLPTEGEKESPQLKLDGFKVIGIIGGYDSPQVYLPLVTLRALGVSEFSQIKIEAKDEENLPNIRKKVEDMGYQTESVADTIQQVNRFFVWINIGLGVLASVAFLIALLGMFNTLTVSLLERTREIGIMKAIGMKKNEVRLLFFFEAALMGFWGGLIGFLSGVILGLILTVALNIFLVPPTRGFIFVIYFSWYYPFVIILLTIIISSLTALLPARRAARISPLNAIRYE